MPYTTRIALLTDSYIFCLKPFFAFYSKNQPQLKWHTHVTHICKTENTRYTHGIVLYHMHIYTIHVWYIATIRVYAYGITIHLWYGLFNYTRIWCIWDLSHNRWSPHNLSPGLSAAAMDGPPRPCMAATLDPELEDHLRHLASAHFTVKNEVWISHHWCNVWHCESGNHTKIGVTGTLQCHILHHIFYSVGPP